eukprot:6954387-Alexandrium_andersonii.AAC.1
MRGSRAPAKTTASGTPPARAAALASLSGLGARTPPSPPCELVVSVGACVHRRVSPQGFPGWWGFGVH